MGGRALVKNVGDLTLFLALIEVCEVLLPKAEPRMLLRHAHVLSLELVEKATAYPHVSGFYKLMRLVVLACWSTPTCRSTWRSQSCTTRTLDHLTRGFRRNIQDVLTRRAFYFHDTFSENCNDQNRSNGCR